VDVTSDSYLSKLSPEARARLQAQDRMMKEVLKFFEENPEEASQMLRAWLMGKG
jgi:flagellar M-ring protein FliF